MAGFPPQPQVATAEVSAEFAALWREHYPRLVRALVLSGLGVADAEDVAQEAFARTLGHFGRVRGGDNPAGYVFRVAFRLARRRASPPLLTPTSAAAPDAEATTRAAVEMALAAMPAARRRCAVACLLAGLSPNEVALALHCAPGTVRKHLAAARGDLRAALGDGDAGTLG